MLNLHKFKNSKKQGDAGLGKAICWFVLHGYNVSIPLTDSQDYDLVIEDGSSLAKVQVKYTTYNARGHYHANLSVKGGNRTSRGRIKVFDPTLADYVFVVTGEGTEYFIPTKDIHVRYNLILHSKYDKFIV